MVGEDQLDDVAVSRPSQVGGHHVRVAKSGPGRGRPSGHETIAGVSDVRALLARPAPELAPELLGWTLTHASPEGLVTVELTEVEAYDGEADPASHAARGRTPRNGVMFGPPGALYVYFSYGMHWCANVVVGVDGTASAVLLRAGRVVDGVDLARARRGPRVTDRALARGPACLTQALGIGRVHDGTDLVDGTAVVLTPGGASGGRVDRPARRGEPCRGRALAVLGDRRRDGVRLQAQSSRRGQRLISGPPAVSRT